MRAGSVAAPALPFKQVLNNAIRAGRRNTKRRAEAFEPLTFDMGKPRVDLHQGRLARSGRRRAHRSVSAEPMGEVTLRLLDGSIQVRAAPQQTRDKSSWRSRRLGDPGGGLKSRNLPKIRGPEQGRKQGRNRGFRPIHADFRERCSNHCVRTVFQMRSMPTKNPARCPAGLLTQLFQITLFIMCHSSTQSKFLDRLTKPAVPELLVYDVRI